MLNMGGPGSLDGERDGVHAFLSNLFSDGEIITLGPLQSVLVRPESRGSRDDVTPGVPRRARGGASHAAPFDSLDNYSGHV